MNKICTSIEQSKKLIELGLDMNTADMWWNCRGAICAPLMYCEYPTCEKRTENDIPAWSLTALLKLIPNYQIQTQNDCIGILYGCKEEIKIIEGETPTDAAFEMVCWLLENKKL